MCKFAKCNFDKMIIVIVLYLSLFIYLGKNMQDSKHSLFVPNSVLFSTLWLNYCTITEGYRSDIDSSVGNWRVTSLFDWLCTKSIGLQKEGQFLSHLAMLDCDIGISRVPLCLSYAGNASKQMTVWSRSFHQQEAQEYDCHTPGPRGLTGNKHTGFWSVPISVNLNDRITPPYAM